MQGEGATAVARQGGTALTRLAQRTPDKLLKAPGRILAPPGDKSGG